MGIEFKSEVNTFNQIDFSDHEMIGINRWLMAFVGGLLLAAGIGWEDCQDK